MADQHSSQSRSTKRQMGLDDEPAQPSGSSWRSNHVEQGYPAHGWNVTATRARGEQQDRSNRDWLPPPPSTYDDYEAYTSRQRRSPFADPQGQWHDQTRDSQQGDEPNGRSQLRLVKRSSDVLAQTETVAVLDTQGQGTSIGRDKVYSPRIRLPVMEISKHHCNLFEMTEQDGSQSFFVSDTGSTYGTFVLAAAAAAAAVSSGASHIPTSSFDRLSDAKKASTPRRLSHGDLLRVAKTIFQVHIHTAPYLSCDRCSLNEAASNEIKLVANDGIKAKTPVASSSLSSKAMATPVGARYASGGLRGKGDRRLDSEDERRRQMAELQSSYLSASHTEGDKSASAGPRSADALPSLPGSDDVATRPAYKDRAAQRRALHVGDREEAGGYRRGPSRQRSNLTGSAPAPPRVPLTSDSEVEARLLPQAVQPLSDDNRGYQLYQQLYSSAQSSSEDGPTREGNLVLPAVMEGRAGIGSRPLIDPHEQQRQQRDSRGPQHRGQASDWKARMDQSKRKRWEEAQEPAGNEDKTQT